MKKTNEIFRQDVYMKEADAKVVSVSERDGKILIELDQTIFFPEGGGQSCDLGTIDGVEVVDVYLYEGTIYHEIKTQDASQASKTESGVIFEEGQNVHLKIDWARRFDNMQRHCGEHILTGIIYKLYGGVNRGFHMGDDYLTIDISMEEDPNFKTFNFDMAKEAELAANEIIYQNLPMVTQHFDTLKEAQKVPVRKKVVVEEDITIVGIGSKDEGWGACACCGTHPAKTGDVGLIKVFKVEPNKGMFRIYFEAGRRAFVKYQKELDVLDKMGTKLSAGTDDLIAKYEAQQDKNKEVRKELHDLKKYINEMEIQTLRREMADFRNAQASGQETKVQAQSKVFSKVYDVLSIDDMLSIGHAVEEEVDGLCCLIHKASNTVLLFSNGGIDCGKLVKENASIYNGKGGGNATSARAIFAKSEYVETFIDLLDKHLR